LTARITERSSVEEVAAIVSDALEDAGITATLSGGSAVTIYSNNAYLSRDLDFVTSAMVDDLKPENPRVGGSIDSHLRGLQSMH
jgi:hypothetical protein